MDWFKGKSTENHVVYHQIQGFPVNFPIIQFYETMKYVEVVNMIFKKPLDFGKKHWIWVEKTDIFFIRSPVRWWPHWPWPQRNGKRSMNGWKQVSRPTSACIVSWVSHMFPIYLCNMWCLAVKLIVILHDFTTFHIFRIHLDFPILARCLGQSEKIVRSLITLNVLVTHSFHLSLQ